jgi:hypothetical protein
MMPIHEATAIATREDQSVKGATKRPPRTEPTIIPDDECVLPIFYYVNRIY